MGISCLVCTSAYVTIPAIGEQLACPFRSQFNVDGPKIKTRRHKCIPLYTAHLYRSIWLSITGSDSTQNEYTKGIQPLAYRPSQTVIMQRETNRSPPPAPTRLGEAYPRLLSRSSVLLLVFPRQSLAGERRGDPHVNKTNQLVRCLDQ